MNPPNTSCCLYLWLRFCREDSRDLCQNIQSVASDPTDICTILSNELKTVFRYLQSALKSTNYFVFGDLLALHLHPVSESPENKHLFDEIKAFLVFSRELKRTIYVGNGNTNFHNVFVCIHSFSFVYHKILNLESLINRNNLFLWKDVFMSDCSALFAQSSARHEDYRTPGHIPGPGGSHHPRPEPQTAYPLCGSCPGITIKMQICIILTLFIAARPCDRKMYSFCLFILILLA